jgi:aspartate/methionine/tyrosine aminotransferase
MIGELANKYDAIVMEDLAYFGMDFRRDLSKPGVPPYQPSVAKYTNNYVLFISSSKIFSYAGQRCGLMVISDDLYNREFPDLQKRFESPTFGSTIVLRLLYSISSGKMISLVSLFHSTVNGFWVKLYLSSKTAALKK